MRHAILLRIDDETGRTAKEVMKLVLLFLQKHFKRSEYEAEVSNKDETVRLSSG